MVKDYKNRQSYSGTRRYRAPKIYGTSKAREKINFKLPPYFFKWIFYIAIVMTLSYYAFFSSQFRIKTIMVEGTNLLKSEDVISAIPKNQNIFLFSISKNEKFLAKKFPEIKQVEIYKGIPDALKITVLEREGKVVWQSGTERYLISSQGEVARKLVGNEEESLPLIVDLKGLPVALSFPLVSPNFVAFIMNVNANLYNEVNIKPMGFEVNETTFDVNLKTDSGFYVKLNSLRSSKKQLENLKQVLMSKRPEIHEYVDLRIDGWAYYK